MDRLRTPFFVIALIVVFLIVLVEAASTSWVGASSNSTLPAPGLGIPYLALVDGVVLFTLGLFGLALIVPARVLGATQGIATFICMLLLLIGSLMLIWLAFMLLTLMVTLLMAVPFGTLAYFAAYADFDVSDARITLGVLMALKIALVVLLLLAQQGFMAVKGLVLLLVTSLLANVVVSFLHGLVPVFLVSILDAVAAIVVGVLAAVWSLVKLIGLIPAIVKGVRLDRHA
jgi:hypothetical protein